MPHWRTIFSLSLPAADGFWPFADELKSLWTCELFVVMMHHFLEEEANTAIDENEDLAIPT
jgi:hypothetical protein